MRSVRPLLERFESLGLRCDHISLDRPTSATAALACFPMYMVANSHLWGEAQPARLPLLNIPDPESIREAFAIGRQEATWDIEPAHREVLAALLRFPKPSDRVLYEFALETLADLLAAASDELAETLRNGIARMILAVAHASGEGFLGMGDPVSAAERDCINRIAAELELERAECAAWLMEQMHH